jgi:hypothetical protein
MDHSRVHTSSSSASCAIMELSGITDDTEGIVYQIGAQLYHPSRGIPVAFLLWSGVRETEKEYATDRLEVFLHDNGLAYVSISMAADNPKTGNPIVVFTGAINHDEYREWYFAKRNEKFEQANRR